jgi:hypothetical protein
MQLKIDSRKFMKDMNNILNYSTGFVEGVQSGKKDFLNIFGQQIKEALLNFIDANARVSPETLHHVYEWYRTGSPDSRLYDISYVVTSNGLSFNSSFSQSQVIKDGSKIPFYNKARIIEDGIPVKIKPVQSSVLAFTIGGEQVFTKKDIVINNPGGSAAHGGFEKTFENFFSRYLSQSFLLSSGIIRYLENPVAYKEKLNSGKNGGKSVGFQTGYRWIVSAGVMSSV